MSNAFLWGLIAASSLIVGGLIGSWWTLRKRTLGVIMAFGAGVLISAVAYELVFEAVRLGKFSGFPTLGLFAGGATFFISDQLIGAMSGSERKAAEATQQSSMVVPLVLAIILDGIPESVAIGKRIANHCETRGLIVRPIGHLNVISPPLIMTRHQIDELVAILGASIRATADDLVREGLWR